MRDRVTERVVAMLGNKLALAEPQAEALYAAGYADPRDVRALKDADLLAIPGIGQASVNKIRRKP